MKPKKSVDDQVKRFKELWEQDSSKVYNILNNFDPDEYTNFYQKVFWKFLDIDPESDEEYKVNNKLKTIEDMNNKDKKELILISLKEKISRKKSPPKRVSPKRVSPKRVSPKRVSPKKSPPKNEKHLRYINYCKERDLDDDCDKLSEKELEEIIKKYKKACWNPDSKERTKCSGNEYCKVDYKNKTGKCQVIKNEDDEQINVNEDGRQIIGSHNDINKLMKLFDSKNIKYSREKHGKTKPVPPKPKHLIIEGGEKHMTVEEKSLKEELKKERKEKPMKYKEEKQESISNKAEKDFKELSEKFKKCLEEMK